jgi:hypothetical protein
VFTSVPIKIHGAFWFGSVASIQRYRLLYHQCASEMHSLNIADDDQSVAVCIYLKEPELMRLWENDVLFYNYGGGALGPLWYIAFSVFNELYINEVAIKLFLDSNLGTRSVR